jgi:cytochrome c oxidase subunit II
MKPRARLVAALACLASLATSCAKHAPLDTLQPKSPIADEIYGLWNLVFIIAVVVFFLVEGALVYVLFRFRRRKGDTSSPVQTHGSTPLELTWTIIPVVLLAVVAFPTLGSIWSLAKEPKGALKVEVTGAQWWWKYHYPKQQGISKAFDTANELHIPTGKKVRLTLKSADVIHSYWPPALAGKQDLVPGRTNHLTIDAARPGTYEGTCTEYCGLSHANMRLKVMADTPNDFAKWVTEQSRDLTAPSGGDAAEGMKVFLAQQCVGCHTVRGTKANGTTGPDLTHFASRTSFAGGTFERNVRNLRKWLTDAPKEKPGSKMPAGVATMGLSKHDISVLIAFLQGLR